MCQIKDGPAEDVLLVAVTELDQRLSDQKYFLTMALVLLRAWIVLLLVGTVLTWITKH